MNTNTNSNNQSMESFIAFNDFLKTNKVFEETMFEANEWITFIDTVLAEATDLESIMNQDLIDLLFVLFEEVSSMDELIGEVLFELFDRRRLNKLFQSMGNE